VTSDPRDVTYASTVRSYDHHDFADKPAYHRLREAMSDLANDPGGFTIPQFLDLVADCAITSAYADSCDRCVRTHRGLCLAWPNAVTRDGDWLTCAYRCSRCAHRWTCGYAVDIAGL
jgi:hypothetical protein